MSYGWEIIVIDDCWINVYGYDVGSLVIFNKFNVYFYCWVFFIWFLCCYLFVDFIIVVIGGYIVFIVGYWLFVGGGMLEGVMSMWGCIMMLVELLIFFVFCL